MLIWWRDNLGERPAQIVSAALMTDYVLTVAVSIAVGVAQSTLAFPAMRPFQVAVGLALIALMMLVNLREVKESGRAFARPTHMFIVMTFILLGTGLYQVLTDTLGQMQDVAMVSPATQPLTLFLVLRVFSSGCIALTGYVLPSPYRSLTGPVVWLITTVGVVGIIGLVVLTLIEMRREPWRWMT